MTLNDHMTYLIAHGWELAYCSCACGGLYAWLKPRPSGAMEMVGCVCHTDLETAVQAVQAALPRKPVVVEIHNPSTASLGIVQGQRWQQLINAVGTVERRANGGVVAPGIPYLVGERPNEEIT